MYFKQNIKYIVVLGKAVYKCTHVIPATEFEASVDGTQKTPENIQLKSVKSILKSSKYNIELNRDTHTHTLNDKVETSKIDSRKSLTNSFR